VALQIQCDVQEAVSDRCARDRRMLARYWFRGADLRGRFARQRALGARSCRGIPL